VRGPRALAAGSAIAAVWVLGCGNQPGAERRGDEAYGRGQWAEALREYGSIAGDKTDPRVWAKAGAAALHAGELTRAADAYLHLAGEDPTRLAEAAEGLETVVRTAERAGRTDAMEQAVVGLQAIAPERVPGRYALRLAQQQGADPEELLNLLPGAIAAAGDQATIDSLLALHAQLLRQTAGCGQALLQYRAVVRRAQDSALRAAGRRGAADCAFTLGERAAAAGRAADAALWYAEAARTDSTSETGRRALLAYGDVRVVQGDTLAAALAFQAVAADSTAPDSVAGAARIRLQRIGLKPAGTVPAEPRPETR
jgi:tetratricopeptide (TPR) repeat protein